MYCDLNMTSCYDPSPVIDHHQSPPLTTVAGSGLVTAGQRPVRVQLPALRLFLPLFGPPSGRWPSQHPFALTLTLIIPFDRLTGGNHVCAEWLLRLHSHGPYSRYVQIVLDDTRGINDGRTNGENDVVFMSCLVLSSVCFLDVCLLVRFKKY